MKVFMDTAFLIAVIDTSDNYHDLAITCYKKLIKQKWSVITTEAVLIEIGNGLSKLKWRQVANKWIISIQESKTIFKVVPTTTELLNKSINLYGKRLDKEWGLTDCISFVVMEEYKLTNVLTFDHHFEQAGYKIFMDIGK
ncbi:PIN domain-containing protein [Candidatus Halobeggiatoa sp. HSG11]|nr:PIN domain-containing protein [Candidatus Halobeggiatoa sp. HSG11]